MDSTQIDESPNAARFRRQREARKGWIKCAICQGEMPQVENSVGAVYIVCYDCPVSGMTPKEKRAWWQEEIQKQRLALGR